MVDARGRVGVSVDGEVMGGSGIALWRWFQLARMYGIVKI